MLKTESTQKKFDMNIEEEKKFEYCSAIFITIAFIEKFYKTYISFPTVIFSLHIHKGMTERQQNKEYKC